MNAVDKNQVLDPWYQALFESNPQPMWIFDTETLRFLAVNEAAVRQYGYSRDDFLAMPAKDILLPEDVPRLLKEIQEVIKASRTGFQKSIIGRHLKKDGRMVYVETAKQLLTFNGKQAVCVQVNDVSERVLAEQKIQHLAYYDELTDLPNRVKLRCELQQAINLVQQAEKSLALMIVELIRFREINYTLSQVIGDELLKQISLRIQQVVGENVTVARLSNIQFGVILPGANAGEAIHLTGRLLHALEEPVPINAVDYELGAHIGIALFPGHGMEPDMLIRHADIALYQAGKNGRDYSIYNAAQDPYKPQRLAMLAEFRKAIKTGQLQLYCQHKANFKTEKITSAEALVRWLHPDYGLISPDQFIPLIEPTALIQPLTQWILEAAIRQCFEWHQKGITIPLAVNLSTRNLLAPDLPETIDGLLQTWGGNADWIGLEITESNIMVDPSASLRVLNQLHQMGFKLFVDDFGTGYSSLSYLMQLPVDEIKIDHSFTMDMLQNQDAAAIVKLTIEMAHHMGMRVIAEGTASKEIWEALLRLGCDEAQGEYISPPIPAKDVLDWLNNSIWKKTA